MPEGQKVAGTVSTFKRAAEKSWAVTEQEVSFPRWKKPQTTERQSDRIQRHISGKNQQGFCKGKSRFWYLWQLWKSQWTCQWKRADWYIKNPLKCCGIEREVLPFSCWKTESRWQRTLKLHNKRRSVRDCVVQQNYWKSRRTAKFSSVTNVIDEEM